MHYERNEYNWRTRKKAVLSDPLLTATSHSRATMAYLAYLLLKNTYCLFSSRNSNRVLDTDIGLIIRLSNLNQCSQHPRIEYVH